MKEAKLRTERLSVGYGGRAVLGDVTLTVRPGEIVVLIGPNGAGKSTLLKSLTRQLKAVSGTIYLGQEPLERLSEEQCARRMSILMTDRIQPELMTCRELVSTGRYPYTGRLGILSPADWRKVEEAMALVHVIDLGERDFNRISDGQRQRVMLARAICQEPEVLVMDEPTSFLDIRHKLELLSLLRQLVRRRRLAVVLSLHELELAEKVADQVVCVRDGRVDRMGPPEEVFAGEYIRRLYGVRSAGLELEKPDGAPEVFVIGGGGSGIPVYRRLQRMGIPFAAGILHENDLDRPVAESLAAALFTERPFCPIGAESLAEAERELRQCRAVLCPLADFGPMNEGNRRLKELAEALGLLRDTLSVETEEDGE